MSLKYSYFWFNYHVLIYYTILRALVAVPNIKPPVAGVVFKGPFNVVFWAGVPKLRPVNKGAEVVGVENKLGVAVVVTVPAPNKVVAGWLGAEVAGVAPKPKVRPVVVAGVDVPNVNPVAGVVEVKDVLFKSILSPI